VFDPVKLNTDNWMESMVALGARSAVLTAKHGCGHLLWPTNVTLPDGSPYTYCVGKEASAIKVTTVPCVPSCSVSHCPLLAPCVFACLCVVYVPCLIVSVHLYAFLNSLVCICVCLRAVFWTKGAEANRMVGNRREGGETQFGGFYLLPSAKGCGAVGFVRTTDVRHARPYMQFDVLEKFVASAEKYNIGHGTTDPVP